MTIKTNKKLSFLHFSPSHTFCVVEGLHLSDLNISTTQLANRNWEIMYKMGDKTKVINYALIHNNSFTVSAPHQLQNDTCQNPYIPTHNRKKIKQLEKCAYFHTKAHTMNCMQQNCVQT